MFCAYCSDKITGYPVKQGSEYYCSLECANLASGIGPDEPVEYYDEEDMTKEFFPEEEE